MIEKLTKEQEKIMHEVRDEWLSKCLYGQDTIDIEKSNNGIDFIYGLANLKPPTKLYFDGPMACQYSINILKTLIKIKQVGNQVWDQVWDQVRNQVGNQVWDQVSDQVRNQVRNQVENQVWNQVGNQVWDQVWEQVSEKFWDQVIGQVVNQVRNQVGNQVSNQVRENVNENSFYHYSYDNLAYSSWVPFYYFFKKIGIVDNEKFDKYFEYLDSGIFLNIMLENYCISCPRPKTINRDSNNELHSETGPAIEWKNGEKYYFVHGTPISQQIIEFPETITLDQIEKEDNLEVQRIMIEKYGYEKFIENSELTIVDIDKLDLEGSSDRILTQTKNGNRFMICTDASTGRTYYIPATPEISTCKELHEEICGFSETRIKAHG